MKLRRFVLDEDVDRMKNWISDERTHAMWCANLIEYPINKNNMVRGLKAASDRYGDEPYVATTDDGLVVGFFCYSYNQESREGMLAFVVVDPKVRGKGLAVEMLKLAVAQAFENPETAAVQLNVFAENIRAKKCYEKAGFVQRNLTPDAFTYKDECWGRCNMVISRRYDHVRL